MSGNITKTKIVAVTAQQPNAKYITVTYQGGQDHTSFSSGNVIVTPETACAAPVKYANSTVPADTAAIGILSPSVGSYVTAYCGASLSGATESFSGKDHVVATGTFGDGAVQVLLDAYV
jgi:hypothetical protein